MDPGELIQKTRQFIKAKFETETSGHDYWHMYRVWQLAKHIAAKEESVDQLVVELAALLHDIADWKFHDGDEEAGPRAARTWLESLALENSDIEKVEDIIRHVSFKGANVASKLDSIEGQIVHDADKLDAMGAIGIGRAFAYGGAKGRPMYDPAVQAILHNSFKAYQKSNSTTVNHFYEKLLLLKGRMYTKTGKEMALHRHEVMEQFLEEYYAEWDGKL